MDGCHILSRHASEQIAHTSLVSGSTLILGYKPKAGAISTMQGAVLRYAKCQVQALSKSGRRRRRRATCEACRVCIDFVVC